MDACGGLAYVRRLERSLSATEYRYVNGAPPSEDWKLIDALTPSARRSLSALCSADLAVPLGKTVKDTMPLEAAVESTVSVPMPKVSCRRRHATRSHARSVRHFDVFAAGIPRLASGKARLQLNVPAWVTEAEK